MAKKKESKGRVSKGQRPNVSKAIRKNVRRHNKQSVASQVKSLEHHEGVIERPHAFKNGHALKKRYQKKRSDYLKAIPLLNKFGVVGLTKAEAIQAVQTNYTEKLNKKWVPRLRKYNESK